MSEIYEGVGLRCSVIRRERELENLPVPVDHDVRAVGPHGEKARAAAVELAAIIVAAASQM